MFARMFCVVTIATLAFEVAATTAAPPSITSITPRGLQVGGSTLVTIDGANLAANPQVVFARGTPTQQLQQGAKPNRVQIKVDLPQSAAVGIHTLRVATDDGISNPILVGVDGLPQQVHGHTIDALPIALTGNLTGSNLLKTTFPGTKGQRVVVDVEARRLGANLKPVVRITDRRGTQLTYSGGLPLLNGDARCELTLPADGPYTVTLHDALYRGAAPGHFRLKVGDLKTADFTMPMAVQQGSSQPLELYGSGLPQNASGAIDPEGAPPGLAFRSVTPTNLGSLTGSQPWVKVSPFPELKEAREGELPMTLPASPVGVTGRLAKPGESDRYRLPVTAGEKIRVQLFSRRRGLPIDGVIDIYKADGARLAGNDDQKGTADPGLDFTVPEGAKEIIVAVRDMLKRGGDHFVYRLEITQVNAATFTAMADVERVNIPAGGSEVVRVSVDRRQTKGPIVVQAYNLPPGVRVAGNTLDAGVDTALLTFTAEASSATSATIGHLVAETAGDQNKQYAPVVLKAVVGTDHQPHLQRELAMAVTRSSPVAVAWADDAATRKLPLGGIVELPLTITRGEGAGGQLRVTLLTNQTIPQKTIKDPKTKKDTLVDDMTRALRLTKSVTIADDQDRVDLPLAVPGDLTHSRYDLVAKVEQLGGDGKKVTATAYSPLISLDTVSPLSIALSDNAAIQAKAGDGETGILRGTVTRTNRFAKPVVVMLAGLPSGTIASKVTVAADQQQFELPVRVAYGTKTGPLKGVQVFATGQLDPQSPTAVVKSPSIDVDITVVPGEKPQAEPPRLIFDENQDFVAMLNQGGGKATLDKIDRHSGQVSLKVTPDQRFNEKLPSLGLKIREKPALGEFRYLHFAWKKQGGQTICLQLNHDGQWGPGGGGRDGATFRYHAGPGPECFNGSLALNKKLPLDWVVITRDLYADFGEFTLTGLAFTPSDGDFALFDALYLGRSANDFSLIQP